MPPMRRPKSWPRSGLATKPDLTPPKTTSRPLKGEKRNLRGSQCWSTFPLRTYTRYPGGFGNTNLSPVLVRVTKLAGVAPVVCGLAWGLAVYRASESVDMRCVSLWMHLRMDRANVKFSEEKGRQGLWIKSLLRNAYYLPSC